MKKMTFSRVQIYSEIAGWYGAAAILAAYSLVSFGVISANELVFQLLNLTGALGIIAISSYKKVRQSVLLNVFWLIIAIIAIIQIFIS